MVSHTSPATNTILPFRERVSHTSPATNPIFPFRERVSHTSRATNHNRNSHVTSLFAQATYKSQIESVPVMSAIRRVGVSFEGGCGKPVVTPYDFAADSETGSLDPFDIKHDYF